MRVLVALGLVLALAACKTTGEKIVENGGNKMSQAEAEALLSDTTKKWDSGEGVGYHAPDGDYLYTSEKYGDGEGKWRVRSDGVLCMQIEQFWGDKDHCNWTLYRRADGTIAAIRKDNGKVHEQTEDMYKSGNLL
jgi:hypothetical protein